jgi:hypothetical protein
VGVVTPASFHHWGEGVRLTRMAGMHRTRVWLGASGAALIAGAIYARTLAPGVVAGDGGELTLAARDLGIAHPPGYPLWVLLAHAATWVPWGDLAVRVNALSALLAALAVGAVWLLAARSGLRAPGCAAASAAFAFSVPVWRSAVGAEVYSLAALLFVVMAHLALEARSRRAGSLRRQALFFFAAGLSMVAHQTLLFPAVLLGAWVLARTPRPGRLLAALGMALLGFSVVLVLPLRGAAHPAFAFTPETGLGGLIDFLLRRGYGGLRQNPFGAVLLADELQGMAVLLGAGVGVLVLVLAGWGTLLGGRRRTPIAMTAAAALTVPAALAAIVGFRPDPEHLSQVESFLIPVVASLALFAGAAVDSWRRLPPPLSGLRIPAAAAGVVFVALLAGHFGLCDRSGFRLPERYGRDLLAGLPRGATLVLDGDNETFLAAYAQRALGVRPDVTLRNRRGYVFGDPYGLRGAPRSQWVAAAHRVDLEQIRSDREPVYFATPTADLAASGVRFVREGLVYRAVAPGAAAAAGAEASAGAGEAWPRSTALLGGDPERFDYVERKLAVTWSDVRARALWEQGRMAEALPWFEDAARVGFDFPEARMNLAVAAEGAGRPDRALAELLAAHALDPRRAEPAARVAVLLVRARNFGEAARWFETAYRAEPDPRLAADAAHAWTLAGEPERARRWSERAAAPRASAGPSAVRGGSPDETLGARA